MFRDKEILEKVINIHTNLHYLSKEMKEIHCKLFQKPHPKFDQELNCSIESNNNDIKLDLVIEKLNTILGDDNSIGLMDQMRYLTNALNNVQGKISCAEHLSIQLHQQAEDNSNMYKKAETMINELKGCISMARASLNTVKKKPTIRKI
jgi:hypothetical protein